MTDTKELAERLRKQNYSHVSDVEAMEPHFALLSESADALDRQQAEIERLNKLMQPMIEISKEWYNHVAVDHDQSISNELCAAFDSFAALNGASHEG